MDRETDFIIAIALVVFILFCFSSATDKNKAASPQTGTLNRDKTNIVADKSNPESIHQYRNRTLHQKREQVLSSIEEGMRMIDVTLQRESTP